MPKLIQYKSYRSCILFFCFFGILTAHAQNYHLQILPVDRPFSFLEPIKIKTEFSSPLACKQYVEELPALLASNGYISASIDSIMADSNLMKVKLFFGEQYKWKNLNISDSLLPVLKGLNYQKENFINQPFNTKTVAVLYERLLNYCSSNGYPFARISLENLVVDRDSISADLKLEKGPDYYIDSIRIFGNVKLNSSFLHHYFDIPIHSLYNQDKFEKINQRIAELPFVQQTQPWNITMLNTGAILNLYLQPRKSNEINLLVGFLPSNTQTGGKPLITGEAIINLKNSFGTGESIGVHWQQLQPAAPRLDVMFQRSYLFNTPFGLDFNFQMYKRDSSFLNVNMQLGLNYAFSANQSGKILLETSGSRLLNVDTSLVILQKRLPSIIDVKSLGLGLQYSLNTTDYRFNPRVGTEIVIMGSAGKKTIRKNNSILEIKDPAFNYHQLYDSFPLQSYQLRIRLAAAHYFPLAKQSVFKTALQTGIFQSSSYFNNELFQIGGYRLLRGFDEESIFANRFAVGTLEYRYLLAQNSYIFLFTDMGWARYESNTLAFSHFYTGAGAGLALETKSGIFNISYAAGKRNDQHLNLRQSKIHLGFVSVF